jgi:hypothetical protein
MGLLVLIVMSGAIALCGVESASAQSEEREVTGARIRAALLRYRSEPSIEAVVRAAIQAPPLDPERARDAAERARLSGLLPRLRADIRRGVGLDLSALQSSTGERNIWSSDDSLSFSGGLTFQLDRLLFAAEEGSLLRERRELEESRFAMLSQVVHLYFERRRLQLERDLTGRTEIGTELRIAETEALLDLFTNGAFSLMMRESLMGDNAPHPDDGMEDVPEEAE